MDSETYAVFGQIISTWTNCTEEQIILVEDISGFTSQNKWMSLPNKFEINLSTVNSNLYYLFFDEDENEIPKQIAIEIGKIAAFFIKIIRYDSRRISGFKIEKVLSLDLESDINELIENINKTQIAASTELPAFQYLKHAGHKINNNKIKINDIEYEIVFIKRKGDVLLNSNRINPDDLKRPSYCISHIIGEVGDTVISIRKKSSDYLSIDNISLIFDKFYRPVRGLGFNFEYTYGEAVGYFISKNGSIVHQLSVDKVKSTEDTSDDKCYTKETEVIRLGDQLPDEMVDFLNHPVKGHCQPKVLF